MVHKKRHWYQKIEMPMPFGGNIEVQKSKWCYICGKKISRGQYCRKCFNKYSS